MAAWVCSYIINTLVVLDYPGHLIRISTLWLILIDVVIPYSSQTISVMIDSVRRICTTDNINSSCHFFIVDNLFSKSLINEAMICNTHDPSSRIAEAHESSSFDWQVSSAGSMTITSTLTSTDDSESSAGNDNTRKWINAGSITSQTDLSKVIHWVLITSKKSELPFDWIEEFNCRDLKKSIKKVYCWAKAELDRSKGLFSELELIYP